MDIILRNAHRVLIKKLALTSCLIYIELLLVLTLSETVNR